MTNRQSMIRAASALGLAILAGTGCVAKRGIDFGHWAATAEKIPLIRTFNVDDTRLPGKDASVLMLPPLNRMPEGNKADLKRAFLKSLQTYCPARVFEATEDGPLADYVTEENLAPSVGLFDFAEAARLGRLLGSTYVICIRVPEYRLYPPQLLTIYMGVVQVSSGRIVAELEGIYDANEQQVVMALDDYLQSRRARGYEKTSLEIMLRSPSEYQTFVCNQCSRRLSDILWP